MFLLSLCLIFRCVCHQQMFVQTVFICVLSTFTTHHRPVMKSWVLNIPSDRWRRILERRYNLLLICYSFTKSAVDRPWVSETDLLSVCLSSGAQHGRRGSVRGHRHRRHHVFGHFRHRGVVRLPEEPPRLRLGHHGFVGAQRRIPAGQHQDGAHRYGNGIYSCHFQLWDSYSEYGFIVVVQINFTG